GALAGGEADADRMRCKTLVMEIGTLLTRWVDHQLRRALAVFLVDARRPQIRRLADMRVGGDQFVFRHSTLLPRTRGCLRGDAASAGFPIAYVRSACGTASIRGISPNHQLHPPSREWRTEWLTAMF